MQLFLEYSDKLSETKSEIVYRYIHPTFGEMFVRCSGIRDRSVVDGISIMGIHQDISETVRLEKEKEAERRLAELNDTLRKEKIEQEDYYKELLEMQSCGVLAYTIPGHKIIHMNAQALRMYGVENIEEAQSKLGTMLKKVIYPDVDVIEKLKRLHKVDDMVDYECIIGKGEPNECHALATTKVIRVPSGERAVITTFLDVSEMVVLKNALQKAEEGNRAKSSFLFAMSHDLRTPMNAIIGYADLASRHIDDAERLKKYMKNIQSCGQNLLSLLNDVLDLARIENNKTEMEYVISDIGADFETWVMMFLNQAEEKKQTITETKHLLYPYVYMDVSHVSEIFINIISNAIKYTNNGGVINCDISQALGKKNGWCDVIITVKDNGNGMPETIIRQLEEIRENGILKEKEHIGIFNIQQRLLLLYGKEYGLTVEHVKPSGTAVTICIPKTKGEKGYESGNYR